MKLEKRYSPNTASTINTLDERLVPYDLIVRLLEHICFEDLAYANYSQAVLIFMPGMGEIRKLNDLLMEHPQFNSEETFKIYPLHSMISSEHQGAVFDIPPPGVRKIVIGSSSRRSWGSLVSNVIFFQQLTSLKLVSRSLTSPASSTRDDRGR